RPELLLTFLVPGMFVALCALHLFAQKQPRGDRGRGDRLVVEVRQQKAGRAVFVDASFGGDQLADRLVPASVLPELRQQKPLEPAAPAGSSSAAAHEQVGPPRGEMFGELAAAEQSIDVLLPFVRIVRSQKAADRVEIGNVTGQIE